MSTQPGYLARAVSVASSLPRRGAKSAVLIVPVVSSGPADVNDEPGAVVAAVDAFLPKDAVSEIEDGLKALNATGAAEQVHRLVVKSLSVASVLTIGLGKPREEFPAEEHSFKSKSIRLVSSNPEPEPSEDRAAPVYGVPV